MQTRYKPFGPALALALLLSPWAGSHAQQAARPGATAAAATLYSCAEMAALPEPYGDGTYWLLLQGQAVKLYCHDMAGAAREYLDLPQGNCSAYVSRRPGRPGLVQTCFEKLRIDPRSLRADVSDLRFAWTRLTGLLTHDGMEVTAMPYATAMSCDGPGVAAGQARLALEGTGFAVVDNFSARGYQARGQAQLDASGQNAALRGGGYCGWMAPGDVYNPFFAPNWNPFQQQGGFLLQLRLLPDGQPGPQRAARCYGMENNSGRCQWAESPD